VDQQLKERMKELGDAINQSLSDSPSISEAVARVKEDGYDIYVVLEATIGISKQGEKKADKASAVSLSMSTSDGEGLVGENVRVAPTKPDGTPHPNAGKTGKVRKVLPLGAEIRAVVELENDFILVSVKSLEILPQSPTRTISD
jgi:hypothetical protein